MTNQRQRTEVEQVGNLSFLKKINVYEYNRFLTCDSVTFYLRHITKEAYYQGSKETISFTSKALKRAIKDKCL